MKSNHQVIQCDITPNPNEKYRVEGASTIIDFVKGTDQFGDGKWLGFSGEDISIVLDIRKTTEIRSVSFGVLSDYKLYIFTPIGARVYISSDGANYALAETKTYTQINGPQDVSIKDKNIYIEEKVGRYIKLE